MAMYTDFSHIQTLASAKAKRPEHRAESPDRAFEYMDALNTIELAAWMAWLYDEPVKKNVRRCCKSVMRRTKDWKVRAIVDGICHAKDPVQMCLDLVADMERHMTEANMTKEDLKQARSNF